MCSTGWYNAPALEAFALPSRLCDDEVMDNSSRRAEEAKDRERMARIVKLHQKPAKKETTRREDVNEAAAPIVKEATE